MPTLEKLPHRFREESFRRYEAIIQKSIECFPEPLRIRCAIYNLSPVTMSCRLRDAMRSYAKHRWPVAWPMHIIKRFDDVYPSLTVGEINGDGMIVIGSRATIKTPTQQFALPAPTPLEPSSITITASTTEAKTLLVHLASNRLLSASVRCRGFTAEEVAHFELNHDVSFVDNEDGTYTLY